MKSVFLGSLVYLPALLLLLVVLPASPARAQEVGGNECAALAAAPAVDPEALAEALRPYSKEKNLKAVKREVERFFKDHGYVGPVEFDPSAVSLDATKRVLLTLTGGWKLTPEGEALCNDKEGACVGVPAELLLALPKDAVPRASTEAWVALDHPWLRLQRPQSWRFYQLQDPKLLRPDRVELLLYWKQPPLPHTLKLQGLRLEEDERARSPRLRQEWIAREQADGWMLLDEPRLVGGAGWQECSLWTLEKPGVLRRLDGSMRACRLSRVRAVCREGGRSVALASELEPYPDAGLPSPGNVSQRRVLERVLESLEPRGSVTSPMPE